MKNLLIRTLKPVILLLLPLILEEVRKIIEDWLTSVPEAAGASKAGIQALVDYLETDEALEVFTEKVDTVL